MLTLFLWLWLSIPQVIRWILIALPITIGCIVAFVAWEWEPLLVGAVPSAILFVLPGQSDSEKKGYNF